MLKKIIIADPKRAAIFAGIILTVVIAGIIGGVFFLEKNKTAEENNPENQPQIYEALTQMKDEKNSDPVEDAKSSMKSGDVLAIFPEGHLWSETERISHLILKLKLKQEDADKLVQPSFAKATAGEASEQEIVRARKYRLKIEKLDFDMKKIWTGGGQPFQDKVFGEDMVEEK